VVAPALSWSAPLHAGPPDVTPSTATRASAPGLADKARFLRRAESYPGRPERVEAVETHMSWVFLAGDRVYKLKKPVVTAFLDPEDSRNPCVASPRCSRAVR
jgi:hypothetical protein